MTDGVKKTVSVFGEKTEIHIPHKDSLDDYLARYKKGSYKLPLADSYRIADGLLLNVVLTPLGKRRDGSKFFTLKVEVLLNNETVLYSAEQFPVGIDEVSEVLPQEIDIAVKNLEKNISFLHELSVKDAEILEVLVRKNTRTGALLRSEPFVG